MARAHFGQSLGNKLHSSASEILRRLRFDVVQATEGFRFLLGCSGFCTRAIITIDLGNEEPALVLAIAATFEIGPREDTLDLCVIPCRPFRSHAHSYSPSIPRNYQFDVMSPSHREMMQPLVTDPVEPRSMEGVEESFRVFSLCAGRRFASRLYDEKSLLKLLSLLPDVRQQQSGFFIRNNSSPHLSLVLQFGLHPKDAVGISAFYRIPAFHCAPEPEVFGARSVDRRADGF
jgi:hypothetical protein